MDHTILAANMWAIWNWGDPNLRYQRFLSQGKPRFKSFIEGVILYNKIIIPTQDFLTLTILVGVLGESAVLNLLYEKSISFLRVNGAFCYTGNGGGIQTYAMKRQNAVLYPFCGAVDEAVSWALNGLIEKSKDPELPKAVLDATTEIELNSLEKEIRDETYRDVLDNTSLDKLFNSRNEDLDRLKGISAKEVRIYGGPDVDSWKGDEIDVLMLLATTNLELHLLGDTNCEDLMTSNPVGHILKAKTQRCLREQSAAEGFTILREIAGIPDIGEGVLHGEVNIKNLLKIKQSRNGQEFVKWFHSQCKDDILSIAREYVELLQQVPKVCSLPIRTIRFLLTASVAQIPAAGFVLGPISGAIDSFFLERWLRGASPKFFIEDLKQIT